MSLRFTASSLLLLLTTLPFPVGAEDLRVEYITAQTQPIQFEVQLSGTLEAKDSLELGFRQSGRVVEVLVEEGDTVERGAALARLDSVQLEQGLRVSEASLASARAAEEQAKLANDRAIALLDRGVGTRAARDAAAQVLSEAHGAVERAETSVDQAQRALSDAILRAPEDAIVTARSLEPGQIVGAAQPVLSLASTGGLEAVFRSPDHPMLKDAMGADVRLTSIDVDLPEMTGVVSEISPLVDPASGTVTVRAMVQNGADMVDLLGAAVRGHLLIPASSGVVVPWTALTRDRDAAAVWIVDDQNHASLRPVTIDYFSDDAVFLSEGIEAGEVVVGGGSQLLYPGRPVQPSKEAKK